MRTQVHSTHQQEVTVGAYIRPAESVIKLGRLIQVGDSFTEMEAQLTEGERAVAVASRGFGKVALLISYEGDWREVKHSGCEGLYAVSKELAATAS